MKYVKEDQSCYYFYNGGKVVRIAKKGLGESFQKKIKGYADGGVVADDSSRGSASSVPDPDDTLNGYADKYGLTPMYKQALPTIYQTESSSGKNTKTSSQGARGAMQVTPIAFKDVVQNGLMPQDSDFNDPETQKEAGVAYLSLIQNKYGKDIKNISDIRSKYIGGPNAVQNLKQGVDAQDANGTSVSQYGGSYLQDPSQNPQYAPNDNSVPFYQRPSTDPSLYPMAQNDPTAFNLNAQPPAQTQFTNSPQTIASLNSNGATTSMDSTPASGGSAISPLNGQVTEQTPPYQLAAAQNDAAMRQARAAGSSMPFQTQDTMNGLRPDANGLYPPYSDIYKTQSNALGQLADAKLQENSAIGTYADTIAKQAQDGALQQQKILADSNASIDKFTNDYLSKKIDPTRLFGTQSTTQQFAGAIGLMLSGIGSGITGQPSQALMVIDKAIDRDIEAQKTNLGQGKTILDLQLQKYGNEKDAEQATRILMGSQALAEMQKAQSLARDPAIRANLAIDQQTLRLALVGQSADLKNKILNMAVQSGNTNFTQTSPSYAMAVNNNPGLVGRQWVDQNGKVYFAHTEPEAQSFREFDGAYKNVVRQLGAIAQYTNPWSKIPTSDQAALLNQRAQSAIQEYTKLNPTSIGATRLGEMQKDFAENIIPNPTSWSPQKSYNARIRLNQLMDILKEDKDTRATEIFPQYKSIQSATQLGFR